MAVRTRVGTAFTYEHLAVEYHRCRRKPVSLAAVCDPNIPQQLSVGRVEREQMTIAGAPDHHALVERHSAIEWPQLGTCWDVLMRPERFARSGIERESAMRR